MDHYVGLDVSLEQTSVRVVDGDGTRPSANGFSRPPTLPA